MPSEATPTARKALRVSSRPITGPTLLNESSSSGPSVSPRLDSTAALFSLTIVADRIRKVFSPAVLTGRSLDAVGLQRLCQFVRGDALLELQPKD